MSNYNPDDYDPNAPKGSFKNPICIQNGEDKETESGKCYAVLKDGEVIVYEGCAEVYDGDEEHFGFCRLQGIGEKIILHLERLRFKRMLDWIVHKIVALLHDGSTPCVILQL